MTKNWRLDFALVGTLIRVNPSMIRFMLRTILFFCLITSAFASETLKTLVNASAGFSAAILQQLATVQGDPTPTKFAENGCLCDGITHSSIDLQMTGASCEFYDVTPLRCAVVIMCLSILL